jgi:NADH:ubiquinone oxidoreductase subunit F (NADH-binding)
MQIYKLLNKINLGIAAPVDLRKLEELGGTIKSTCVCGLGMTAANPILTVLHNFKTAPNV